MNKINSIPLWYRKLAWSAISLPILYKTWWAYGWQIERKVWKEEMLADRQQKLGEPLYELKSLDEIPTDLPKAEFDKVWLYRPLAIRGVFDHSKESLVARTRHDERGFEIITPLFTKVDASNGGLSGILVNRGRIPIELKESKMHLTSKEQQYVEGVLMYSEEDTED